MPVSLYTASKYAITGMSETLRYEIANAQIDVKVTVCIFFILKLFLKILDANKILIKVSKLSCIV